ncbi:hypothetical protein BGZ61DRAFT_471515 [Ilyonectria robusta]|uniref:uncharacterized protein n=1 Tax=Ilyonectria robusta TaxID=1079257 RepID=UPI001E8D8B75|nr:uncharacterized protein BGZ61DRAFT_471515 [Ilyonectria robusta]KAH8738167.1 hypothetical protein BGZ61DRAFT_471515 [Ilyonectria robusta]
MAVSEHQSCSTVPCRLSLCGMCNGFVEHNEVCGCLYRGRVWGACSAIDREPTHGGYANLSLMTRFHATLPSRLGYGDASCSALTFPHIPSSCCSILFLSHSVPADSDSDHLVPSAVVPYSSQHVQVAGIGIVLESIGQRALAECCVCIQAVCSISTRKAPANSWAPSHEWKLTTQTCLHAACVR